MTRLRRWSFILLVAGILSILAATWFNRPSIWRPLAVDASSVDAGSTDVRLRTAIDYEVSLEIERQTARAVGGQLFRPKPQSAVTGSWNISCGTTQIAAGDFRNYIRVETVASWRGELYRLVARVPFGVDEANYWGFGLAGNYLSERVVGAFQIPDDIAASCEFSWAMERTKDSARIAIRRSEQDWRKHSRQSAFLPVGGTFAVLLGSFALLLRGLMVLRSRRDGSTATRG